MKIDSKQLDIRTVLMILSHLTEDLREMVPESQRTVVQSEQEAQLAVASLLEGTKSADVSPAQMELSEAQADVAARETLALLLNDPETAAKVTALLEGEPADSQLSVELATASAIVFGVLVTWMQTKLDIKVRRKDGKVEYEFALRKNAASSGLTNTVAGVVKKALFL
jgi:hypothetical protein